MSNLEIDNCLAILEDTTLNNVQSRINSFETIKSAFDQSVNVTPEQVRRTFSVLINCVKDDIKHAPYAIAAVKSLLTNVKSIPLLTQDYMPSTMAVLNIIKIIGVQTDKDNLRLISLDLFLSYPVEVLAAIVDYSSSDILEIFKIYAGPKGDKFHRETCHLLHGLLKILPSKKKLELLNQGLDIWFGYLIPSLITTVDWLIAKDELVYLECLETLTDNLLPLEYKSNKHWLEMLKCICQTNGQYLRVIKNLLEGGSNVWHRLWIVVIKLLKEQITFTVDKCGIPINSMLPIVEMAFKMDVQNRCYAFQCWEVLIDSFSKDPIDNAFTKRLKLLLIPLKAGNAKTEIIALTKFNCWWHLITAFDVKLDMYMGEVLLSFIQFAFGRNACGTKPVVMGAVQLFDIVQSKCIEAFVNIVGHANNCNCETTLPRLKSKIMTSRLLVTHWTDWMYALKIAINVSACVKSEKNPVPVLCAWRYIISMLVELPNNGIRRDLFNELIQVMMDLTQNCSHTENLSEILNSLILSLFQDEKAKDLVTSNVEDPPMFKILSIVLNPEMDGFYSRCKTEELIEMWKPMTLLLVQKHDVQIPSIRDLKIPTHLLGWVLYKLSSDGTTSLKLWTALAESVMESNVDIDQKTLNKLLMWPLYEINIPESKYAATPWYTLYNAFGKKLNKQTKNICDKEILRILNTSHEDSTLYFRLYMTIGLLKDKLVNEVDCTSISQILQTLTSKIHNYQEYSKVIPVLVDTIVLMATNIVKTTNIALSKVTLNCCRNLLKVILNAKPSPQVDITIDANIVTNILDAIYELFQVPLYSGSCCEFIDELKKYLLTLNKDSPLFKLIVRKFTVITLLTNKINEQLKTQIISALDVLQENDSTKKQSCSGTTNKNAQAFTIPESNKVVKSSKKKEASIITTVMENGEEYVVVKSNWKFNPKKLTENQKEKLQRKREDIPALYQDLSQSQDEFKMSTWTTDSQDTTSSNSKSSVSTTSNDAIKNVNSSDVIPTIMQNILSKNNKTVIDERKVAKESDIGSDNLIKSQTTPQNSKSPRMALKDRVFRNVRNLIENSVTNNSKNDNTEKAEDIRQNLAPKTPTKNLTNNKNIVNSDPSLLSADRPSRMKRIPRKFDDVQLFGLKKKRNLANDSHFNNTEKDVTLFNESKINGVVTSNNTEKGDVINVATDHEIKIDKNNGTEIIERVDSTEQDTQNINNAETDNSIKLMSDNNIPHEPISEENKTQDHNIDVQVNATIATIQSNNDILPIDNNSKSNHNEGDLGIIENVMSTPVSKPKVTNQKSTGKKSSKKSRIEKELAIDMIEGHPFLTIQSSERLTRKRKARETVTDKINKTKGTPKTSKKAREVEKSPIEDSLPSTTVTVEETQDKNDSPEKNCIYDNPPCSEDIIESSQDSTFTAISVKSTKRTPKRVSSKKIEQSEVNTIITHTQDLLQDSDCQIISQTEFINQVTDDDIELPQNKTAELVKNQSDLTENMDTEPIAENNISEEVVIINSGELPIKLDSEKAVGPETQELAEADTQPNNPSDFEEFQCSTDTSPKKLVGSDNSPVVNLCDDEGPVNQEDDTQMDSEPNVTVTTSHNNAEVSTSFTDEAQRKQDFLNNTSEISPIKVQSPDKEKSETSPPHETSNDYVLVKLSSPVQSNGEPFDKSGSPEFFTEDKVSPEKRDISPPRTEITVNSGSPSSVLSLKKNRPQVRPGGRAAQMLGLCVPDSLNTIKNVERSEPEENKKSTSTPVRRNLRTLYNAVSEANNNADQNADSEKFLNFKKSLPSSDCSPSVPILKRKLVDIVDDTTASPANKRKRVSFHDPPVSTTVSVQKYIEPKLLRSPNSPKRMTRSHIKSPRQLENSFVKLDTILSKAVESFTGELMISLTNDTNNSLDITPAVEIVKTSELNDTDPICPELVDCEDSIENIALELSSPAMKELFVKELKGNVNTVGDLAKMTELEVNRLCIKAPKVQIAKKVLKDYASKSKKHVEEEQENVGDAGLSDETALSKEMDEEMTEPDPKTCCVETQTDKDIEIVKIVTSTQTDTASIATTSSQTVETGFKRTSDVITSCLSERIDFVDELSEQLNEASLRKIADKLSTEAFIDMLTNKADNKVIIDKILDRHSQDVPDSEKNNKEIAFINNYLCDKYNARTLVLLCSQLLQKVYEKPA